MLDLSHLAQSDYKAFTKRLVKTNYPILGVRLPALRLIAKSNLSNNEILNCKPLSHEEVLLKGFVVALSPCPNSEFLQRVDSFLVYVDNWATCDSFCAALKRIKKLKEEALNFFAPYRNSENEYCRRFLAVLLMNYYLDTHMDFALNVLLKLICGSYYTDMAVAWAFATALAKDFSVLNKIFSSPLMSDWVKAKTISKAIESYRINNEQKQLLKQLRKSPLTQ